MITSFVPGAGSGGMLVTVTGTDFGATPAVVRKFSPTGQLLASYAFGNRELTMLPSGAIWIADADGGIIRLAP